MAWQWPGDGDEGMIGRDGEEVTVKDETSGVSGTQAILRTQEEADVEGKVPGTVGR